MEVMTMEEIGSGEESSTIGDDWYVDWQGRVSFEGKARFLPVSLRSMTPLWEFPLFSYYIENSRMKYVGS